MGLGAGVAPLRMVMQPHGEKLWLWGRGPMGLQAYTFLTRICLYTIFIMHVLTAKK